MHLEGGAGIPDAWGRLWAPHRMEYLKGENRPLEGNNVACPFCTIPSLSDSNPTNDLLTAYPDMYLHCCLIYAATYIRDAELVGGMESLYNADKERVNTSNWNQDASMATKQG